MSTQPTPMVTMIAPDGTAGQIPQEKVNDAATAGFKLGIDLISPDGKVGTVPVNNAHDALKAGFKLKPTSEAAAIAQAPNATQQAQTSVQQPLTTAKGSTLGGVYSALNEGGSTANPKVVAAQDLNDSMQRGLDEAAQGKITTAGVAMGGVKGAAETAHTIGRAANAITGDNVTRLPKSFEQPASLQPENTSESNGKGAEGVLEFIAGDQALKGLSWAQKFAKMGKLADILEAHPSLAKLASIGLNATRQGTVGAAQTLVHGGSAQDAATTGALTAVTGGALEVAGEGIQAVKNFITRTPEVEALGKQLVEGLTEGATPEQVAKTVGKNLADAEEKMHSTYDAGIKSISAQGQGVPVKLAGSPLQQTAKDLLTDSNIPENIATSLKGVIPDSDKIEPFLTQLSDSKQVLSWDEMEATRQKIGQTIRKLPWDSPIRPDLIKLRYAIDDTLQQAADNAGKSDLSDQIKSLRSQYAQTNAALEERAIKALADKNPNAVADVLLNKQSVHNVQVLRRLIGPENMKAVEGSVLDKMVQDASKNGELAGRQLFRKFNSLGPDAQQAIWGDRLPQIKYFVEQANKLPNPVLNKIVNHFAPYAGGAAGATYGAISGFEHDGLSGAAKGAAVGAAAGTGISGLSALLRNPYVLDAALKSIGAATKVAPPVVSQLVQQSQQPQTVGDLAEPTHRLDENGKIVPLDNR